MLTLCELTHRLRYLLSSFLPLPAWDLKIGFLQIKEAVFLSQMNKAFFSALSEMASPLSLPYLIISRGKA